MLHIWMILEFFYFTKPLKYGNLDFKIQFKGIWVSEGNRGKLAVLNSHFFASQISLKNKKQKYPPYFDLQNSLEREEVFRVGFVLLITY